MRRPRKPAPPNTVAMRPFVAILDLCSRDSSIARAEADVRVMAVRLGKFADFLIKVERFAASIRYWTETGSKG